MAHAAEIGTENLQESMLLFEAHVQLKFGLKYLSRQPLKEQYDALETRAFRLGLKNSGIQFNPFKLIEHANQERLIAAFQRGQECSISQPHGR